jgi:hypothetical protein
MFLTISASSPADLCCNSKICISAATGKLNTREQHQAKAQALKYLLVGRVRRINGNRLKMETQRMLVKDVDLYGKDICR